MFRRGGVKDQRVAVRHLIQVGAIAAANHRCHRNAARPKMPQHHRITLANAVITHLQKAKPVALMNVDPGVIQHQIRRDHRLQPPQRIIKDRQIGGLIGMSVDLDIEIAFRLARRVIGLAMQRAGKEIGTAGQNARGAVTLMNITVKDQDSPHRPLLRKADGAIGKVIEYAIAGAVPVMGMMRAAGGMAG